MSQWVAAAAAYLRGEQPAPTRRLEGRAADAAGADGKAVMQAPDALRAVLAASPQAIIAIDPKGNVQMWSPAAERILGWSADEVLARPFPFVLEDGGAGPRTLAQALRESGPWNGTRVSSHRKNGAALEVRVWAVPLNGPTQSWGGFVIAIEEVAKRARVEDAGGRHGAHPETLQAIVAAALRATDLQGLFEETIDRTLGALDVMMGAAWIGQVSVARGVASDLGTALAQIAPPDAGEARKALCVADWRAGAPADAPKGIAEQFMARGIRASIITSFGTKGGLAGGLVVASAAPRPWTPDDLAAVESVGEVLAAAAPRLRLFEETQQRLRLFDRFRTTGRTLHRRATVAEVGETIGDGARVLGSADRTAVYLCQPDGTLACPWSVGLSHAYVDQVLRHAKTLVGGRVMDGAKPDLLEISGRGIDGSAPVLYPDVLALSPAVAVPRLTQAEGYRALASWPLVYEGAVLGLIGCYYDAPRTWSAPEQKVFQGFCEEAAFALHNAGAREAQMKRTADLEVLFELTRLLRAARNTGEIYPILVGRAMDLLHADSGVLTLLDGERLEFECVFAAGLPPEVRGSTFPLPGSPFERVVKTGTTFQTPNFGGDPLPVWLSSFRALGPAVIVPVRSEQEIIGVFCLGRKRRSDASPFAEAEARLLEGIAEIGGNAIRRARLFENLEQSYLQMVISLARTMDARDTYTSGHSERISEWAEAVARDLGCGEGEVQDVRWGALLHDIGKIGVPDAILLKPGDLTGQEWAIMRRHPVIGAEILTPIGRMRGVAALVRHHQEKWDGTGYPDGLKGEEIPLGARILAVCDAYSAITDERPYQKARDHAEAVAELHQAAGTQFDPRVVEAFCRVIEREREREKAGQRPR